ncbi:MAG TPA: PEP-CTERM sorting domain-containing protein [Gammaproteobacteria bacterium]|nr:PEP-CTERM sorting domain-containing protein [Gammaproteobacteria bacterium]
MKTQDIKKAFRSSVLAVAAIAAGLAVSAAASAGTTTLYGSGGDTTLGFEHTFDGLTISAWTYDNSVDFKNATYDQATLFQRNTGGHYSDPDEWGIGVGETTRNGEIDPDEFLKLDFGTAVLPSNYFSGMLQFTIGSLQTNEQVGFWIGDPEHNDGSAGFYGSLTGTSDSNAMATFDIPGSAFLRGDGANNGFNNLYIVGLTDDVLLQSITSVPEPGVLAIFGFGLLVFAGMLRRRHSR